jgi:hypothetical protein
MKPQRFLSIFSSAALATICLNFVSSAALAAEAPATAAKGNSATNSETVELPIPLSVFDATVKPTKDPFFPLSTRQPFPQISTNAPAFSASCLTLKGISGATNNRLAIINNRTMAAGEDSEVTIPAGKVRVHCVKARNKACLNAGQAARKLGTNPIKSGLLAGIFGWHRGC